MISQFIITFRETLEVALIVGIILSYLVKINQVKYNNIVYVGLVSGIVASIIGALLFTTIAGGFEGRAEQVFEGTTMLIGAVLLTTMILWMMRQKHIAAELEQKVAIKLADTQKIGLFLLVFVAVLREGTETVIFLQAASFASGNSLTGALAGIIMAIFLGYLMFVCSRRVNLKMFFNATSLLLILFAAGLVAHGVHELSEAGFIPELVEHVWDINPPVNADRTYPLLHEKGHIGSILKGLFGYNGDPSLAEVLGYIGYLGTVFILWKRNK